MRKSWSLACVGNSLVEYVNSIGIRPSSPVESLITLKAICSTISLLIPGILEVIMWYMRRKGL